MHNIVQVLYVSGIRSQKGKQMWTMLSCGSPSQMPLSGGNQTSGWSLHPTRASTMQKQQRMEVQTCFSASAACIIQNKGLSGYSMKHQSQLCTPWDGQLPVSCEVPGTISHQLLFQFGLWNFVQQLMVTESFRESPLPKVYYLLLAVTLPKLDTVSPALDDLGTEAVASQRQSCHNTEISQKSYVRLKEAQGSDHSEYSPRVACLR